MPCQAHDTTFSSEIDRFRMMYGIRNVVHYKSLSERTDLFDDAVKMFDERIRQKNDMPLTVSVASLFARACAILDFFGSAEPSLGIPVSIALIEATSRKYPPSHCTYCGHEPCDCPPNKRPNPKEMVHSSMIQTRWTVADWQGMLAKRYGKKNAERGVLHAFSALQNEVVEIRNISFRGASSKLSNRDTLNRYFEEIGDVFARIFALANLPEISVDVGEAITTYSSFGCPGCGEMVCECDVLQTTKPKQKGLSSLYCPT